MAILLAIGLTIFLQPLVNRFSGQIIPVGILMKWQVIISIIIAPFVVGILSGLYPALFMSSFQPVKVLKGVFKVKGNLSVRKVLVVSQFAISIVLIISTIVVFSQLKYMQEKSLGFNKEHIILMNNQAAFGNRCESFRTELLQNPSIKNITRSSRIPSGRLLDDQGVGLPAGDSVKPSQVDVKMVVVDYSFIPTFGIGMAAGRNFSTEYPTDSSGYILNETAAALLGWKDPSKAINNELVYGGKRGRILGVAKDFHFESLHQKIVPLIMFPRSNFLNGISIKLSGTNIPASIDVVEKTWKKYLPETSFDYSFLDTRFDKLYEAEQKQESVFTAFSIIAIFIACLGLFGLSAFTISQRIKEIGIRKVLGASVKNIVGLLSKDFLKLVVVAAFIAFPVAWFTMNKWLEDFAYRINIQWWVFLVAGIIAAAVAWFTIGLQAVKAATTNPVKNLRTE
jgi:putative ABC transport system permease protein